MPRRPVNVVEVSAFLFDEVNEEKFAAHGLTVDRVEQVLDNLHVVVQNRRRRRGSILIIGRDNGGACIAIPAESVPTYGKGCWRPITAWPCKSREHETLKKWE